MKLLTLLLPLFTVILPASAKLKDDPRINALGNCAKSCLTTTLTSASSICDTTTSASEDYDSTTCLCATNPLLEPHISSLKHCTDACSIGQRESLYKIFAKDKNCAEVLGYLKGPRGDGKQKVLKKEEEKDDIDSDVNEGEGGKTKEELEKEEKKKKQDKITFYSFLTAVGVIIFSVIGGMML